MVQENMTKENGNEDTKVDVPAGNNAVLNAFRSEFSTTVNNIYVNSLKKEIGFSEITVDQQKKLSKIMISNENRKDMIYDTQCALINQLCLEKDFNIYEVTEFDRIRILMDIYSGNYFNNDIRYKCPECGAENVYKLDFTKLLNKLNAFTLDDITFKAEDRQRYYNFTLNYPYVSTVSNFYKNYMKNYKNTSSKEREILDNIGNIDYTNLFIKSVEVIRKDNTGNKMSADLTTMTYKEVEDLIACFPQEIIFSDNNGVLKFITTEFIEKINNVFQYEKCAVCGAQTQEGLGSVIDFF